jgi:DNA-binding transcriptional regulator YiaG
MIVEFQSELLGAIHETATGLHKIGVINDKEMQEYDEGCLAQEQKTASKAEKSPEMEHITA